MIRNTGYIDESNKLIDYDTLKRIIECFECEGDITIKEFTAIGMEVLDILKTYDYLEDTNEC